MSLPRFIVLKSNHNERYLGYVSPEEFKDIDQGVAPSRDSFLRFDRNEVSTTHTKFEVEPAKAGNDLVHLKSCHNDKYWVRWSPNHWWIVAAADKPEEDRSKWSCTLFKPIYVDQNANTVRFIHFQLGHYACLWRIGLPFGGCLFGGSKDPDQDSCDVVTVIDWESLSTSTSKPGGSGVAMVEEDDDSAVDQDNNIASLPSFRCVEETKRKIMTLPRFIVLKSNYNERYLGYVPPEEFKDIDQGVAPSRDSFLRFDRDEVSTTYTKFEVERAKIGNGLVHLKSCHNNKYWVRWSTRHYWIVAAADKPEEDRTKWWCTLFKPICIDRNANTVRFLHLQLGHYACLWRIDLPFGYCLFGGSKDPDQDSCDVVTVIDWESLTTSSSEDEDNSNNPIFLPRNGLNAIASLKGDKYKANGTIAFSQQVDTDPVRMIIRMDKIPYQFHAIYIKTYGDISRGSASSEPTFCYLGNFHSDTNDKLEAHKATDKISLTNADSIIGRTIVVYSKSNPDHGDPLAWGVIGHTA